MFTTEKDEPSREHVNANRIGLTNQLTENRCLAQESGEPARAEIPRAAWCALAADVAVITEAFGRSRVVCCRFAKVLMKSTKEVNAAGVYSKK
ncbi:hypothetical protein GOODEAATRI_015800 [Goodea atripinnis]|uniref:Uncharacterized protein n=1 Tax=Goodea atripinnis TaxID=208336 RepID=A0ABV0NCB1_9TELE